MCFPNPVYVGDTVSMTSTVIGLKRIQMEKVELYMFTLLE